MHVLLCAIGTAGDVHPLLGVGLALRARGHGATVVTNPFFEATVRGLGLDFLPLGDRAAFVSAMADPDLWHPTRSFRVIARRMLLPHIAPLYALIARHDPATTVVFASGVCFGARIAQERLGTRLVTHHLAPSLLWSRVVPPVLAGPTAARLPLAFQAALHRLAVAIVDRTLGPATNAFRRRLGLPPARDLFFAWPNSPARVLGLFPAWFAPPQPDWPPQTRLTGFPLFDPPARHAAAPAPPGGSGDGPAPLVFTPGSGNIQARRFFAAAIEASAALGRPALLLTRHREQLPATLPAGVIQRDYLPLRALLPRAAALIHHGGIGTTAQGLAAGLPQLLMPMSYDQPDNAARLGRLGVGAALPPARFTGPRVADALAMLLRDDLVRHRCHELAARCDPEAALEATVRAIEEVGSR